MAGGQKGLSFVGEPMVFAVVATAVIMLLLFAQFGGCDGSADTPMDKYDAACEQEYADANDGDSGTEVESAILEQPDCMAYVAAMKVERQQEYRDEVQEATP